MLRAVVSSAISNGRIPLLVFFRFFFWGIYLDAELVLFGMQWFVACL
ncbi:hypothetical protein PHOSAC3_120045 [Mesotoga infera]|nr:hypothetical protein PHOSAC3_120045 [Mesotoga infera]